MYQFVVLCQKNEFFSWQKRLAVISTHLLHQIRVTSRHVTSTSFGYNPLCEIPTPFMGDSLWVLRQEQNVFVTSTCQKVKFGELGTSSCEFIVGPFRKNPNESL